MSARLAIILPPAGIAYAIAAASCAVWATSRKTDRILWSLAAVIFSIALLNALVEEWPALDGARFWYLCPALLVLFLAPYRSLCLRLIERTGLRPSLMKEMYSFLPLVYAGFAAIAVLPLTPLKDENPPFARFLLAAFVCALHVPLFAAGRSKVMKFVAGSGIAMPQPPPDIRWGFIATVSAIMGAPAVLALGTRALAGDGYRLFVVDGMMTAAIFSLLAVSRRGQIKSQP